MECLPDEDRRRISLRRRKRDVEFAPNFNPKGVLEPHGRRARSHFRLSAEVPEERVPEEPADQAVEEAEMPQAAVRTDREDKNRSVAEDLHARVGNQSGTERSLPHERPHADDDGENEKEEKMATVAQAAEAVAVTLDKVDEPAPGY